VGERRAGRRLSFQTYGGKGSRGARLGFEWFPGRGGDSPPKEIALAVVVCKIVSVQV